MRWMVTVLCTVLVAFSAQDGMARENDGEQKKSGSVIKMNENIKRVVFAGGCFWCMEKPFESLDGVKQVLSGYTGGHVDNPTYKQVSAGHTGHYEVIEVAYDPSVVDYSRLLEVFWKNIDPHDAKGQFCDKGDQYRAAIFVENDEQRVLAEASRAALAESGVLKDRVVTEIVAAQKFYPAEDYHQDYYKRNPIRYNYYRYRCGRDERLKAVWGE